jgi:S-adenosylmethionine decarboxylase proenzyme
MTMTTRDANAGSKDVTDHDSSDGFTIDVRLLIALLTVTMAASFGAGFFWVPDATILSLPKLTQHVDETAVFAIGSDYSQQSQPVYDNNDLRSPSGQHLLVDMKNIDADFLDSEERLIQAMVETIDEAGLTMLSYHCHSLAPSGISCVGILLESHISFHTWPFEGVITLDLFACGSRPLLPVIKTVERLFGWPASSGESVITKWAHELRGFYHSEEKEYLDDSSDLALMVLSPLDVYKKEQVYSNITQYQRIDIWDLVDVRGCDLCLVAYLQ